jgi:hypothetical protein
MVKGMNVVLDSFWKYMPFELKEFLLTGNLGPIHCGMTERDVIKCLGEPPEKRVIEKAHGFFREVRFYYDSVTLFFQDDSISLYGLWIEECDIIPKFLEPSGYFPIKDTSMDQFLEFLKAEQIPFRERKPPESSLYKIFTEGGVAVMGWRIVRSLVIPCPGTERWRTIMRTDQDLRVPMKKST